MQGDKNMKIRKSQIVILGIVFLSFLLSVYFYRQMPEKMATHWDAQGEVDGYMPKIWTLLIMPLTITFFAIMFFIIVRIDPLKKNIEKFQSYYDGFIIVLLAFLLVIHYQIISWSLGIKIGPERIIPIGLGFLFFYIGVLCQHSKRNWFIGIKTPWTLSSDTVWDKTHKLGGKLFKITGVIVLAGLLCPCYMFFFILVPVILVTIITVSYSYFLLLLQVEYIWGRERQKGA